jgi:hypothetical protein
LVTISSSGATDDLAGDSGRGVESRRRSKWPELPSAHTPPVSAWSNRRDPMGSTAAITAGRPGTKSSYGAIASTRRAARSRWLLVSSDGASARWSRRLRWSAISCQSALPTAAHWFPPYGFPSRRRQVRSCVPGRLAHVTDRLYSCVRGPIQER